MKGLHMTIDCPDCGGDLEELARGRSHRTVVSTILRCPPCRREWHVSVTLRQRAELGRPAGPMILPVDPRELEAV